MDKKYYRLVRPQSMGKRGQKLLVIKRKDFNKYFKIKRQKLPVLGGIYQGKLPIHVGHTGNVEVIENNPIINQSENSFSPQLDVNCKTLENIFDEKPLEIFSCELCLLEFRDQLHFFLHLKSHYEPRATKMVDNGEKKVIKVSKIETTGPPGDISHVPNVHCIQCNKTFQSRTTYDRHVKDVHLKVELNEFSDHEDILNGVQLEEFNLHYWDDET